MKHKITMSACISWHFMYIFRWAKVWGQIIIIHINNNTTIPTITAWSMKTFFSCCLFWGFSLQSPLHKSKYSSTSSPWLNPLAAFVCCFAARWSFEAFFVHGQAELFGSLLNFYAMTFMDELANFWSCADPLKVYLGLICPWDCC